jgi:hypothetical protein
MKTNKDTVEAYAQACWDILLALDIQDGHCKSYDPLTIDEAEKIAHSYVFDLWDGGRHHKYGSLYQVINAIKEETVKAIKTEYESN